MKVDIFFKNQIGDMTKTFYLGELEIVDSLLEKFSRDQKEDFIQGMILTSLSDHIEWTPVSEEEEIKYDNKLN